MTSYLKKIADIEDRSTGEHQEIYEYLKSNGTKKTVEIRPSEARTVKAFRDELLNKGAVLPSNPQSLLKAVVDMAPENRAVWEKQAGWLEDRSGFVLPDGFVGLNPENILGVKRKFSRNPQGATSVNGTAKAWQSSVAEVASYSSYMITAICTAFAAPLLRIADRDAFTICFSGPSRKGKTSITLAAASVIGIGGKEELFSWNRTIAQLEEEVPRFNDCLFPIDDLEGMTGRDAERYQSIRELSYKFASGNEKARHSSFDGGHATRGSWRSILLTSNEVTIAKLASSARRNRKQGELTRLIDIPVAEVAGHQIFDLSTSADDEAWRRRQFKKFYEGCHNNHGKVFSRYIRKLIDAEKLHSSVERRMEFFRKKVTAKTSSHLAREMITPFSLLYAAGRLARDFDLVPWSPKEIRKAITVCYRAAVGQIPDDQLIQVRGVEKLQIALKNFPSKRTWSKATRKAKGYCDNDFYVVERNHFEALFDNGHERGLVMDWLKQHKRIKTTKSKTGSASPIAQLTWPDGTRKRSITILGTGID